MSKDEILVPILTAINCLREEVRENRREIQKNREAIQRNREAIQRNSEEIQRNRESIQRNSEKIDKNSGKIDGNTKEIISLGQRIMLLEKKMEKHEDDSKKDRKAILDILYSYEQVTDRQYEENKKRIEKLEEKFAIISA